MHESDDNHMVYEPDHTITNAQESNHSNIKRALIVIGILVLILAGTALSVIWYVSLPPTIDEQEAEQVIAPEKILPQHEDLSGAPLVKPYLGTQISATLVDSIFEDGWYSSGRQPFVASATEMMLYEEPVMGITLTALPGETVSISRNVSLPEEKNTLYFCLESVGESEGHLEVQFTSDGTPVDQARLITAFRLENARVITPPNGDILMRELPNWLVNGTGTLSLLLINSGTEPASLKVTNFHYYGEGEYLLSPEDAVDRCLVRRAEAVPEANSPEGSPQFQAEVTRARESIKIFAKPGAATSSHIATLPTGMTRPNSTEFGRNGSTVLYESNFNGSWSDYVNNTQLADVYRGPVLSDDGNTVAYIREQAVNNTTSLVLVNGGAETILPNYTRIRAFDFVPGTTIPYFVGTLNKKDRLVVNGIEGPQWDKIEDVVFSSKGGRLLITYEDNDLMYVTDTVETYGPFGSVSEPYFSADESQAVYMVRGRNGTALVINGELGPIFENTVTPGRFIDTSNQLFYTGFDTDSVYGVLFDGEQHRVLATEDYTGVLMELFAATKDAEHTAMVSPQSNDGLRFMITMDGTDVGPVSKLAVPAVYPTLENPFVFAAENTNGQQVIYFDGKLEVVPYDDIVWPKVYGTTFTYKAEVDEQWGVVANGTLLPLYDSVRAIGEIKNSNHWYYVAQKDGSDYLYVNGQRVGVHTMVFNDSIVIDDTNDTLYYGAQNGNELWWVRATLPTEAI